MPSIDVSLVCPEALVFLGEANQVDLPGTDGDFGVLPGHAPIVSMLRPGIVRVFANGGEEQFVILGGVAEFSQSTLTVLADSANPLGEFDVTDLEAKIEEVERSVTTRTIGEELDRDIALLDHYRTLHRYVTVTTAL